MRGTRRVLIGVAAAGALATGAVGGPIGSATFTNKNSDRQAGSSGYIAQTVGASVRFVRVTGTLTRLIALSSPSDATIWLQTTSVTNPSRVGLNPFGLGEQFSGGVANVDRFVRLPQEVVSPAGQWLAVFDVFGDFGSGVDARWSTVTITLNDGPPMGATDVGVVTAGTTTLRGRVDAGAPMWMRLTVPGDIKASLNTSLEINTLGSQLSGDNDTVITLYNEDGLIVAGSDDAYVDNHLSRLAFGLGGDGSDLRAGTYWLGVRSFGGVGQVGWDMTTGAQTGPVTVNVVSNAGRAVFCAADMNKSGTVTVQDLFDYLAAFFGACS